MRDIGQSVPILPEGIEGFRQWTRPVSARHYVTDVSFPEAHAGKSRVAPTLPQGGAFASSTTVAAMANWGLGAKEGVSRARQCNGIALYRCEKPKHAGLPLSVAGQGGLQSPATTTLHGLAPDRCSPENLIRRRGEAVWPGRAERSTMVQCRFVKHGAKGKGGQSWVTITATSTALEQSNARKTARLRRLLARPGQ